MPEVKQRTSTLDAGPQTSEPVMRAIMPKIVPSPEPPAGQGANGPIAPISAADVQPPPPPEQKRAPRTANRPASTVRRRALAARPARRKQTINFETAVLDEARGAVQFLRGTNHEASLNQLASEGLEYIVRRLRKLHNDGQPFDQLAEDEQLPAGR